MEKINIRTYKHIQPKCYAYTTPEILRHDGWTKIGYTEKDSVEERIKEQTKTANIKWVLGWKDNAIFEDGEPFTDKAFHAYLEKNDIDRLRDEETKELLEWFKILPAESKALFDDFKKNHGIMDTDEVSTYKLREEQNKAIDQTQNYFKRNEDDEPEFLWNAKPRFGKTLTAYSLCMALKAKTVLIVTNRPAIANSWYEDYEKYIGTKHGYYFVSEVDALKNKKYVLTRETYSKKKDIQGCIEFISLQDLKGSTYFGGRFDKLVEVKNTNWDILIIDEAHEGVDTFKTDAVFDNIKRKYTLHLSGTPFKALANEKFKDKAIFNWTYADEQKAKRDWNETKEEENPYAVLPQLNLFTYQMSEIVRENVEAGKEINGETKEYAFDLNEFFITNESGKFKYEEAVDKFLDALTYQDKFPFSSEELRNELKHTFWLLDRVDSAKALEKKLKTHDVFKDYKVVLAVGNGKTDDEVETKKAYDKVIAAIKEYDKTITLSVRQLTTGITVPQWSGVLMLSNVKSPSLYIQAAFRAQNPCLYKIGSELYRKENAYVFDFDPARTLTIFENFANGLSPDTSKGDGDTSVVKKHVYELLNFFPVYGEDDEGQMIELDAEKVLTIPRKIHAKEVVRSGFMSNFLFQNIGNVFGAPTEVVEIIKKMDDYKEPLPINDKTREDLSLGENGEVNIPENVIIGTSSEIFGNKIYGLEQDLERKIDEAIKQLDEKNTGVDDPVEKLKKDLCQDLKTGLVSLAKDKYGKEMTKSTENLVVRKIATDTEAIIEKKFRNYIIDQNTLKLDKNKEIEKLKTENKFNEIESVQKKYEQEAEKLKIDFVANVKESSKKDVFEKAEYTIIEAVEKDKKQKEKNEVEEKVRDHLRGFSRTVPSFLMAYGDENTTLENFDKIIPDDVFREVTSITLDEFRFLRDGGDYFDKESNSTRHFEGHLFDAIVFNDSIKEFLALKQRLGNYFDVNSKEDIFDYIPPQKTNQIYTPKKVVKEMVDLLEKENPGCFDDDTKTFVDLYVKSGLYITEIVKRLFRSSEMKKKYPNDMDRLRHIFEKQVYGLAPTEIIFRIAKSYILGFDADVKIEKHNLRHFDTLPSVQAGTLEKDLDKIYLES